MKEKKEITHRTIIRGIIALMFMLTTITLIAGYFLTLFWYFASIVIVLASIPDLLSEKEYKRENAKSEIKEMWAITLSIYPLIMPFHQHYLWVVYGETNLEHKSWKW